DAVHVLSRSALPETLLVERDGVQDLQSPKAPPQESELLAPRCPKAKNAGEQEHLHAQRAPEKGRQEQAQPPPRWRAATYCAHRALPEARPTHDSPPSGGCRSRHHCTSKVVHPNEKPRGQLR